MRKIYNRIWKTTNRRFATVFILLFALAGVQTLLLTRAAVLDRSIEPEQGTAAGNASVVSNASASAGAAISFSADAPTQCSNGGTYLWSNLSLCGWPNASNAGYPAGRTLTASGSRTITTDNTVIDGLNVTGNITVNAKNVTIKNSFISYSGSGGGGSGAIKILSGASATIDHVEINGNTSVHACIWHEGSSMTVTAVNCHHVEDGIFSWADTGNADSGSNFTITDSYIHDLGGSESNGHLDGYQAEGATNGIIRHNTFDVSDDASGTISIWNGQKTTDNILVENNLLTGGGFTLYAQDYHPSESNPVGGYSMTNIRFINNSLSTKYSACVGYWGVWFFRSGWVYQGGPTGGWGANGNTRSGNKILETGYNLDNGNPAGCS